MNNLQTEENIEVKKKYVPAFVLAIITVVFAFIITSVSYICGVIALILAYRKRKEASVKTTRILAIIGLVIAVINHIINIIIITHADQVIEYLEQLSKIVS